MPAGSVGTVTYPASQASHAPASDADWWRTAVVYEIYPRSFRDSDGDGVGDLEGVRQGLGYLESLGVDAIWFTPWYRSPLADSNRAGQSRGAVRC